MQNKVIYLSMLILGTVFLEISPECTKIVFTITGFLLFSDPIFKQLFSSEKISDHSLMSTLLCGCGLLILSETEPSEPASSVQLLSSLLFLTSSLLAPKRKWLHKSVRFNDYSEFD